MLFSSKKNSKQNNSIPCCLWAQNQCNRSFIKIADGLFTYYMVENMALGNNMTQQEQEIRNVL